MFLHHLFMKLSWRLIFLQTKRSAVQGYLLAYKITKAQQPPKTSTHQFTNSQAYKLINLQVHKLTNLQAQKLTSLQTHQLKTLNTYLLFYNIVLNFAPF